MIVLNWTFLSENTRAKCFLSEFFWLQFQDLIREGRFWVEKPFFSVFFEILSLYFCIFLTFDCNLRIWFESECSGSRGQWPQSQMETIEFIPKILNRSGKHRFVNKKEEYNCLWKSFSPLNLDCFFLLPDMKCFYLISTISGDENQCNSLLVEVSLFFTLLHLRLSPLCISN